MLWRGGLLLAGGWAAFEGARLVLGLFDIPIQAEIGGGLILGGSALVLLSLLLERMQDARQEGDSEP